ncbi:MAG: hypothetical protein GWP10_17720 [Nitrospiraceae bacterium]|nr:hypothetical protein [Nitrospiraceae bacterium]
MQKKNKAVVPDHFFREIDIEFLMHELKGPISIIEAGMKMILKKQEKFGKLSIKQKAIIERSLRNSIKAREMIYGLLEIGRSEADCFECSCFMLSESLYPCIIDSLEASGCDMFDEPLPIENRKAMGDILGRNKIELNIPDAIWEVPIFQDEFKFRQITRNLIGNALHYRKESIQIRAEMHKNLLAMDVVDDGPGIAPEDHKIIFERYRQINTGILTNRSGHGLGLAGSYILAKRLKGDIEIVNHKGNGAMFRLTIPVAPASA